MCYTKSNDVREPGTNLIKDSNNIETGTVPEVVLLETPQEQLDWIRSEIAANPIAAEEILPRLPSDANVLDGQASDPSVDAVVRAASWLCHDDPLKDRDQLLRRFTMAAIYYSSGGESWKNQTNWLSEKPLCTRQGHPTGGVSPDGWWGISCCGGYYESISQSCSDKNDWQRIVEISLSENNLSGIITKAYVLLPELASLDLSNNQLTGAIPGAALGSMANLTYLYLQHNQLTGEVPGEIGNASKIGTLSM